MVEEADHRRKYGRDGADQEENMVKGVDHRRKCGRERQTTEENMVEGQIKKKIW
jgi:hypothetical protein